MAKTNVVSEFGSTGKKIPALREMDRSPKIPDKDAETNEQRAERQKDKLPSPKGWRLLVIPVSQPTVSAGGIAFTEKTRETQEIAGVVGQVVSMGPMAYKDEFKFMGIPWCEVGDFIIFPRYAGSRVRLFGGAADGSEDLACRLLNDDEVLATVPNPLDFVGLS